MSHNLLSAELDPRSFDLPPIRIAGPDLRKLETLLGNLFRSASTIVSYLDREVGRAMLTEPGAEPALFVRMGSRVRFADDEGRVYTAKLVFPQDQSTTPDGISILTSVGAALLGLAEEQTIAYETPDGRRKTITVIELLPGA